MPFVLIAGFSGIAGAVICWKIAAPFSRMLELSEESGPRKFVKTVPERATGPKDRWINSSAAATAMTEDMVKLSAAVNAPVCEPVASR